jgi:predicted  nucleic acid-binding Zn-ribbon protein
MTKQTCTNPWHAGTSLGSQFLPGCPSCGTTQPATVPTNPERAAEQLADAALIERL